MLPLNLLIRKELPADVAAISRVTEMAFREHPHSSHTEQFIIDELRRTGALSISLVAEREGRVVGHIAFSPVEISDGSERWYGLGPVSVLPEMQGKGIGRALIEVGLLTLREFGAEGCVLLGNPKFYERFGFRHRPECVLEGVPQEYFQSLTFGRHSAAGRVSYHEAFNAKG